MKTRYKLLITISVVFNVLFLLSVISIASFEPPSDCAEMWPGLYSIPSECHPTDELFSTLLERAIDWIPSKILSWIGWYPDVTLD